MEKETSTASVFTTNISNADLKKKKHYKKLDPWKLLKPASIPTGLAHEHVRSEVWFSSCSWNQFEIRPNLWQVDVSENKSPKWNSSWTKDRVYVATVSRNRSTEIMRSLSSRWHCDLLQAFTRQKKIVLLWFYFLQLLEMIRLSEAAQVQEKIIIQSFNIYYLQTAVWLNINQDSHCIDEIIFQDINCAKTWFPLFTRNLLPGRFPDFPGHFTMQKYVNFYKYAIPQVHLYQVDLIGFDWSVLEQLIEVWRFWLYVCTHNPVRNNL